jgi:hypothetical protein
LPLTRARKAHKSNTTTKAGRQEALTAVPNEEELDKVVVVRAGPSRRRSHRAVPPRSYRWLAGKREKSEVVTSGKIKETLVGGSGVRSAEFVPLDAGNQIESGKGD